ncbi:thiamine pyrophosphate-binding protein [Duganella hordei]|uniref:thiamine pyrophosphate-binding protein n=1 Tax=Duganella hordei TaxID=2865934 RepID=UPI0030E7E7ED
MFDNVEFDRQEQSRPVVATAAAANANIAMDMADLLVAYLEQLGVDYIFGVPGGAIEPLYNAIARNQRNGGNLSQIVARNEAGAAFMADGYARETGKLGVCMSTSGPGATNMLTAVATSHANGIPVLVITAQPNLPSFGKTGLQESSCTGVDVLAMFSHCTRYNTLVSHPDQLEWKLVTALQHASHNTPGPVHLSVPSDVFRAPSKQRTPSYDLAALQSPAGLIDHAAIDKLRALLAKARNVVMLIGGGCGDSIHSILQFADLEGATFIATTDGKGLVNPRHPLYRGTFGFGGHATADAALRDPSVDLILAAGCSMGEWDTGGWSDSLLNNRLVHIGNTEEHLARTPMAGLHVRGALAAVFNRLVDGIVGDEQALAAMTPDHGATLGKACYARARRIAKREQSNVQWNPVSIMADETAFDSDAVPIKPQRLMKELGSLFPHGTRFLADAGSSAAWAIHYLQPRDRRLGERRTGCGDRPRELGKRQSTGGWLRLTSHFAPMGWAIGAAVGTAAGNPTAPVVCITGDGSMLMSGQELSVAVAEQQCVIFVILNDAALGMVKHGQRLGGGEQIAFALPQTDFAGLARALGGRGHTIRSAADLQALDIKAICNYPGPTLLDVQIDPDAIPPMGSRLKVLLNGGE